MERLELFRFIFENADEYTVEYVKLLKQIANTYEGLFTLNAAAYWFAYENHNGMNSDLYHWLSASRYEPSVGETVEELIETDYMFETAYTSISAIYSD